MNASAVADAITAPVMGGHAHGQARVMLRLETPMRRSVFPQFVRLVVIVFVVSASPRELHAQLLTQHVKGALGLKAGSQPPPGGYVPLPVFYLYNTSKVKDRNGDRLPGNADLTSTFFGAGYSHVTTRKILGGFYGFSVLFPVGANNHGQVHGWRQ